MLSPGAIREGDQEHLGQSRVTEEREQVEVQIQAPNEKHSDEGLCAVEPRELQEDEIPNMELLDSSSHEPHQDETNLDVSTNSEVSVTEEEVEKMMLHVLEETDKAYHEDSKAKKASKASRLPRTSFGRLIVKMKFPKPKSKEGTQRDIRHYAVADSQMRAPTASFPLKIHAEESRPHHQRPTPKLVVGTPPATN